MQQMRMLWDEIIVDNFAGGGGASSGIEAAIGRSVDIAINHDPAAIAMHKVNHPMTEHYCESVWDVDPIKACGGRPVGLAWFSPDCKHFSKAKGGKPVDKNIRGLAWVALRWAATVKPRVIMLENVEEFKTWGPVINGRPDPKQKGRTFNAFVNALKRHGYRVEWKELRACDYGAPTIRKRFFLIARCDNLPITWPKPTHGNPESTEVKKGKLKPWHTAAEIINWDIPCPSIFDRKKPLAENTMNRIAKGLKNSSLIRYHGEQSEKETRGQSIDKPIMVVDASPRYALVASFLAKHYGGGYQGAGADLNKPMPTVTTVDHNAVITSNLVQLNNNNVGQPVTAPLNTVTAGGNHFAEVRAFLIKYYGDNVGQNLTDPLHTVTTKDRFGLVTIHGQDYYICDIGMRMLEPRELFNGQGFKRNYVIDFDFEGKKFPKSKQVAKAGNAVPPALSEALVRANLPELCISKANVC